MGNYVNENLLDASPYKKQQDESKHLVSKWDKTGLLDGLNEDFKRSGMAVMLENQARQLISENSSTGGGSGGSNTATAGSEEWSGVALPLVRRIFGEIAAQDFVSVQPMNLPSGLVFYLDFKYGKTTAGAGNEGFGTNNDVPVPGGDVKSLQGKTGPNSPSGSSAPYGVGGLYGEGRYDYSINHATSDDLSNGLAAAAQAAPTDGKFGSGSATYKDINFNQEHSASLAAGDLAVIYVNHTTDLTNPDLKAARSFNLSGSTAQSYWHSLLPQYTKVDGNYIKFVVSASSVAEVGMIPGRRTIPASAD